MTIVVIGMLVCLGAAAAILVVVALPKFHEGAPLLTEEGEDAVRDAQRRARFLAARARRHARVAKGRAQHARERAQQVAEQAGAARDRFAEQASAARERVAVVRAGHAQQRASRRADTPTGRRASPSSAGSSGPRRARVRTTGPAADATGTSGSQEEKPLTIDVRDRTVDVRDTTIDVRDVTARTPVTPRRGAHRRQGDFGWGDPVPGPRHAR